MKNKKVLAVFFTLLLIVVTLSGCTGSDQTGKDEFSISNIVFCSEEPVDYMTYKEQPNAMYLVGNNVWIYMNLNALEYNTNSDGTKEIWIAQNLKVKTQDNNIVIDQEVINEHINLPSDRDTGKIYLKNHIDTSDYSEGKYTVEIVATDKLVNRIVQVSSNFTLSR